MESTTATSISSNNSWTDLDTTTFVATTSGFQIQYYVVPKRIQDLLNSVVIVVIPIIATIGIVGSCLALVTMRRIKTRSSTTYMLCCLSVLDILALVTACINVFQIASSTYFPDFGKHLQLKLIVPYHSYLSHLPSRIGYWVITIITIERLFAVLSPMKVKLWFTKRVVLAAMISTCCIISLLNLPKNFLYEVKQDPNGTHFIGLGPMAREPVLKKTYILLIDIINLYTPTIVVFICNTTILIVVISQAKWRNATMNICRKKEKTQISRMLTTISVVFMICLLPSCVSRMLVTFDSSSEFYQYNTNVFSIVNMIGFLLQVINNASHFFIYFITNQTYRNGLKSIIYCRNIGVNKRGIYSIDNLSAVTMSTSKGRSSENLRQI